MSKKPKIFTFKKQLLGILLVVICFIPTIWILSSGGDSVDWTHFYSFVCNMQAPGYILLAVLCVALSVFCESAGLFYILRKLKAPTGLSSSVVYATSDIYFSAITPSATGGQPASAYYMIKNKVSASGATVALLLNITIYVFSLLLLGGIAFALKPQLILGAALNVRILFFTSILFNFILLLACILFMVFPGPSRVIGHFVIVLLSALHIIKDREKSENSFKVYLNEYRDAFRAVVRHPLMLPVVLLTNVMQRIFIYLVPFFVFLAIEGDASVFDVLTSQALVTVGVNSVPIPGAVGVSEYLFLTITASFLKTGVKKSATLLTRLISHYFCFLLCGVYTFIYHCSHVVKKRQKKENDHEHK